MAILNTVKNTQDIMVESFSAPAHNLRVALVTETFAPEVNGVAMTLGRVVGGLLQRGHEVQVVRPKQSREAGNAPQPGLDEVLSKGVPIPNYPDLHFGLPFGNRLLKLWQQRRPDIVHVATEGPLGWSAVTAARKLRLPVTSSFHTNFDNYAQHYGIGLIRAPIEAYLRKLHNRTRATMVPTQALMQQLQARGYRNLTLMSRGVAIEQFRPLARSEALRERWGVAPHDVVLLYVGRLAKEKNLGTVLATCSAVQARLPRAKMVFVGDGPMRKALQEACPQAVFCGLQAGENLAAHYASGDLFLFPSVTETYGNVVPEALASGLAVLSYAHAAAANLIRDGRNGALVPLGDELAFVHAGVALASDPHQLQALRSHAAASVAHMGWDTVFDNFILTLRTAIAGHEEDLSGRRGDDKAAQFNPTSA